MSSILCWQDPPTTLGPYSFHVLFLDFPVFCSSATISSYKMIPSPLDTHWEPESQSPTLCSPPRSWHRTQAKAIKIWTVIRAIWQFCSKACKPTSTSLISSISHWCPFAPLLGSRLCFFFFILLFTTKELKNSKFQLLQLNSKWFSWNRLILGKFKALFILHLLSLWIPLRMKDK